MPAYRAMPAKGGPFPIVLVVQEIFGVHEHIKDLCRRLAKAGYFAIAPELYARQGDARRSRDITGDHRRDRREGARRAGDVRPRRDRGSPRRRARPTPPSSAITGFCWGGRIVWMYAAHNPSLKAGVAWYGRLDRRDRPSCSRSTRSTSPTTLQGPVLGLYGGADQGIPQSRRSRRCARPLQGGRQDVARSIVYPDAPHGFNADYRPSYRKDEARGRLEERSPGSRITGLPSVPQPHHFWQHPDDHCLKPGLSWSFRMVPRARRGSQNPGFP